MNPNNPNKAIARSARGQGRDEESSLGRGAAQSVWCCLRTECVVLFTVCGVAYPAPRRRAALALIMKWIIGPQAEGLKPINTNLLSLCLLCLFGLR